MRKLSLPGGPALPSLVVVATAALMLVPSTFGGQPVTQTLTPPPPSFETCKAVGSGTICQGSRTEPPFELVGSGISCGSGTNAVEILDSWIDTQHHAMRYYDQAGNLTRRVFTDNVSGGHLTNPLTGTTVPYTQHTVTTGVLAVPGDLSTETQAVRGETIFTVPHLGAIFLNAGKKVYAPDGSVDFSAGPNGFDAYFIGGDAAAVQQLCSALGAS